MRESLSELAEELVPIHQKLVHLRRQLVVLGAKQKPPKPELKVLLEELRKIDACVSFLVSTSPYFSPRRLISSTWLLVGNVSTASFWAQEDQLSLNPKQSAPPSSKNALISPKKSKLAQVKMTSQALSSLSTIDCGIRESSWRVC